MKKQANSAITEKRKEQNSKLSLYITIGATVLKRFSESHDESARKLIEDSARSTKSFSKREQLEKLLQEYA